MDKNFLKEQEEKLEKEKAKIEEQLKLFARKSKKGKENWQTKMPVLDGNKEEEEADQLEEYLHLEAIKKSLEEQLKDIDLALKNIKKGKYGICEVCGKEIEKNRLKAIPQARTCSKCREEKL